MSLGNEDLGNDIASTKKLKQNLKGPTQKVQYKAQLINSLVINEQTQLDLFLLSMTFFLNRATYSPFQEVPALQLLRTHSAHIIFYMVISSQFQFLCLNDHKGNPHSKTNSKFKSNQAQNNRKIKNRKLSKYSESFLPQKIISLLNLNILKCSLQTALFILQRHPFLNERTILIKGQSWNAFNINLLFLSYIILRCTLTLICFSFQTIFLFNDIPHLACLFPSKIVCTDFAIQNFFHQNLIIRSFWIIFLLLKQGSFSYICLVNISNLLPQLKAVSHLFFDLINLKLQLLNFTYMYSQNSLCYFNHFLSNSYTSQSSSPTSSLPSAKRPNSPNSSSSFLFLYYQKLIVKNMLTRIIIKNLVTIRSTLSLLRNRTLREFATIKKTQKEKNNEQLTLGDIIGEENILQEAKEIQPEAPKTLLSQQFLKKCSPLMQKILHGASAERLQELTSTVQQPEEQSKANVANKHDLEHFRHMLAGTLPNEVSLDKFCLKKTCPLVLDVKYDGQRTLISFNRDEELQMISRNGKSQIISYQIIKERIQKQLMQTDIKSIKMDGEIVVVDQTTMSPLPLGELLKLKGKKNEQIQDWQLQMQGKRILIYIFDVVEFNNENLMTKTLLERRKFIPNIEIISPVEYKMINFPQERAKIFDFFKEVLSRKYEGIIIKGANDFYYTNQTRTVWKKLKRGFINLRDPNIAKVELDLIVMGANRGMGFKNKKQFTSYLMGTRYNGKIIPISNVGSGFNEQAFNQISKIVEQQNLVAESVPQEYDLQGIKADIFYKPQMIFEIHAQQFTVSPTYNLGRGEYGGLSLRFPSFKRIRQDKGVKESTSGEEILQLSKAFNLCLPK